jgi:uncharacterized membrane protein
MTIESNPIELQPTSERLCHLARNGVLDIDAFERALEITGSTPDRTRWVWFLDMLFLVLGAGFTVSGIFFFFAFNWASLHRFLKLGLLEAAVLLAVGLAILRGLDSLSGKIALGVAGLLVGALLAVYGQIYQTGADSYQLFLGWALLTTGWVLLGRFTPLWLVWIVLLNLGIWFYWAQIVGRGDNRLFLLIFLLNGAAILAWELAHTKGVVWLKNRWMPRLLALPAFAALVLPTTLLILPAGGTHSHDFLSFLLPILYIGASGLVLYVYSRKVLDLFMLVVCAFGLIVVFDVGVFRMLEDSELLALVLLSVLLIAQAALVVAWLRRVSNSWETECS